MAGGSTDVKNERLPVDGFVIKRDSAVLNKPLINMMRGMYRDNKRDYPTVPAKTSWDEEIFTPKEVDMWGLQNLRAINNSSDNAAHNNIDELIWQSENVMRGYQKGDVVEKQGLLAGLLSMLSGAGRRQKAYEEMVPQDIGMQMPSATSPMPSPSVEQIPIEDIWERVDELAEKEAVKHYVRPPQPRVFPSENVGADPHVRAYMSALNLGQQDVFDILEKRDPRRLNLLLYGDERGNPYSGLYGSYQKGDIVGYQYGKQVVDPNDPLNIDARMQMGAQAYPGGVGAGDVAEAVEADEMRNVNQVMEMLKLQGIYNEPERSGYFEFQGDVPQSKADQMRMEFSLLRDMENQKALNQLLMQSGRMGGQLNPEQQGLFFKP